MTNTRTIGAGVLLTALFLSPLALVAGCSTGPDYVVQTVIDYIAAVNGKDMPTLYRLRAGCEPPPDILPGLPEVPRLRDYAPFPYTGHHTFDLLRERCQLAYHRYEKGKKSGRLTFTPLGVVLIRGLVLGRGVMYTVDQRIEHPDGRVTVYLEVDLNYEQANYRQFPEGTIIYFMGCPLGTIKPGTVGQRLKGAVELLDSLRVRVELVPAGPASPHGWRVLSFTPDDGSETCITVTGHVGNRSWLRS